jgi:hypothetical protein
MHFSLSLRIDLVRPLVSFDLNRIEDSTEYAGCVLRTCGNRLAGSREKMYRSGKLRHLILFLAVPSVALSRGRSQYLSLIASRFENAS